VSTGKFTASHTISLEYSENLDLVISLYFLATFARMKRQILVSRSKVGQCTTEIRVRRVTP
jgi:hypothetical protein